MAKKALPQTLDTPARRRLLKEIGAEKLSALEKAIAEGAILDTPARQRLKKRLGQEGLARIEARILSGEA